MCDERAGPRYVSVKLIPKLSQYDGTFSESAIRHLIFGAEDRIASDGTVIRGNGLAPAILRIGRRVLIDLEAFDCWLETHRVCGSKHE